MTLRLQNTDPSLPGSIILYLSLRQSQLASTSTNHSAFVSDGLPSTARWKPVVSEGCTCESVMTISIISVKKGLPTWSRTVLAKLLKGLLVVRVPTRILPSCLVPVPQRSFKLSCLPISDTVNLGASYCFFSTHCMTAKALYTGRLKV